MPVRGCRCVTLGWPGGIRSISCAPRRRWRRAAATLPSSPRGRGRG